CDAHEGPYPDDFPILNARRGRNTQRLPRSREIGEERHAVGFARDVGNAVAGGAKRLAPIFGELGEAVFPIESRPDRATHQAAAGNGGEDGGTQPADGYAPAVDRLLDVAVEAERRFIAELNYRRSVP